MENGVLHLTQLTVCLKVSEIVTCCPQSVRFCTVFLHILFRNKLFSIGMNKYTVIYFSATTVIATASTKSDNCKPIDRPNMRSFCRNSSTRGYFCTIRCNSGYTLKGARRVTCENGQFSPSIENHRCEKRKMPEYIIVGKKNEKD